MTKVVLPQKIGPSGLAAQAGGALGELGALTVVLLRSERL